jgi:hypothetical protein
MQLLIAPFPPVSLFISVTSTGYLAPCGQTPSVYVKFRVLTAASIKMTVLWDVAFVLFLK